VTVNSFREITNKDEIFNNNKTYNNNKIINNNKHINNREFVTYEKQVYNRGQNIYNNNNNLNNNLNNINNISNNNYINSNNMNNINNNDNRNIYNNNNLNNINNNNNYNNNNITNNNYNNNMSKTFNSNLNKKNINEIYSFECMNENSLQKNIEEGTNEAEIIIKLKNTSQQTWMKGDAKLVFINSNLGKKMDILLDTQKPGEIKNYKVVFNDLSPYQEGDYKSILRFNINDQNIGKPIKLTVSIEESKKEKEINEVNKIVTDFKNKFDLISFTDEKLLEILKKNNFDFNKSFESMFY